MTGVQQNVGEMMHTSLSRLAVTNSWNVDVRILFTCIALVNPALFLSVWNEK